MCRSFQSLFDMCLVNDVSRPEKGALAPWRVNLVLATHWVSGNVKICLGSQRNTGAKRSENRNARAW